MELDEDFFRTLMMDGATHEEWDWMPGRYIDDYNDLVDRSLEMLEDERHPQYEFRHGDRAMLLMRFQDEPERSVWGMLEVPLYGLDDITLENGLFGNAIYNIQESVKEEINSDYLERRANPVRPFGFEYDATADINDLRKSMTEAANAADLLADEYRQKLDWDPSY